MFFRNLHPALLPVRSTGFSRKTALITLLVETKTSVIALLLIAIVAGGKSFAQETATQPKSGSVAKKEKSKPVELLKGNDLSAWKKTNFGGESDVTLKDLSLIHI